MKHHLTGKSERKNVSRPLWVGLHVVLALSFLLTGCESPPPKSDPSPFKTGGAPDPPAQAIDPTGVSLHDDIVAIRQFWQAVPWLMDAEGAAVGFRAAVYFVSGETEKGSFVPGTIFVWLYRLDPGGETGFKRVFVHNWEFSSEEAMGFRVRRVSVMGYYYGMLLTWPPDVDVVGKQVEIFFGYERADGRLVTSAARRFRVPVPPGYRRPMGRVRTTPVEPTRYPTSQRSAPGSG